MKGLRRVVVRRWERVSIVRKAGIAVVVGEMIASRSVA